MVKQEQGVGSMSTRADFIERQIKKMLLESSTGRLELQRSQLAEKFDCVPSQISYVLETRFTFERGYLVESKRGSGGYIRIARIVDGSREELVRRVRQRIGSAIDQDRADDLLSWLQEEGHITQREAAALRVICHRDTLALDLPARDMLRARILQMALPLLIGRDGQQKEA